MVHGSRRISREELYRLVWETPVSRLATEFGLSGNGLAKICDRLEVPYPPRGYWAKKEAGKPVVMRRLLKAKPDTPNFADIQPSRTRAKTKASAQVAPVDIVASGESASRLDEFDDLHPLIKAWVKHHREEQTRRSRERRRSRSDSWGFGPRELPDLTERDIYRFRATSTLIRSIHSAGAKVMDAIINGTLKITVSGQEIEMVIREKMRQGIRRAGPEDNNWTAYPDHHQTGLHSSGFLRIAINTYLGGSKPQWIESETKMFPSLLPEITASIIAAGPRLEERQREHEEWQRKHLEEQARQHERRRLKEVDERRWSKFREQAAAWEESKRLEMFIGELQRLIQGNEETTVDGLTLQQWMEWAEMRRSELNPFSGGIKDIFRVGQTGARQGFANSNLLR